MNKMIYTPAQQEAICHTDGPLLVSAGPGSGKTSVIIAHIRFLIRERNVDPERILTVTFTRAAAREMQERFRKDQRAGAKCPRFGTIHSIFYEILRESSGKTPVRLISEQDRDAFWRARLASLLKEQQTAAYDPEDPETLIRQILTQISRRINTCGRWEDIRVPGISARSLRPLYEEYQDFKKKHGLLDQDDILTRTVRLLKDDPQVLAAWQNRFSHILVDEFQDINLLQYEGICLLSGSGRNLYVVGDEDQSIYGFRGSLPQIMEQFRTDHPGCRTILLDISHRAPDVLMAPARNLIRHDPHRLNKYIRGSERSGDAGWDVRAYPDKTAEYAGIASLIRDYTRKKIPNGRQAVLLRSFRDLALLKTVLMRSGIPYQLPGNEESVNDHFITRDITAALKAAAGQYHRSDLLRVLAAFCPHVSRYLIPEECSSRTLSVMADTCADPLARKELAELIRHLDFLRSLSAFAALQYLLHAMGYEKALVTLAGQQDEDPGCYQPVLTELLAVARQHPVRKDFLSYLRQNEVSVPCQEEDAVKILTMHGSKGLEFDVVYIPDLNKGVVPDSRSKAGGTAGINEERRLLYVAMTRARRRLHLSFVERIHGKAVFASEFLEQLQSPDPHPPTGSREMRARS